MKREHYFIKIYICLLIGLFVNVGIQAQKVDLKKDTLKIKAIPYPLITMNNPLGLTIMGDSTIELSSKEKTNLFNSPSGNYSVQNAPMLLFHPDSNFILSAKVTAKLKEVYDVASLVVYQDKNVWAKLCFENSINKETTIVSVVTREFSDDCNSIKIKDDFVYVSIAKKGNEFSFYCSTDTINWELVRHFRLDCDDSNLMLGFAVHCSRGEKFSAKFSDIKYSKNGLENMRIYK